MATGFPDRTRFVPTRRRRHPGTRSATPTIGSAIQAGAIHGDVHIYAHPQQPPPAPPPEPTAQDRANAAAAKAYRGIVGPPPIALLFGYFVRILVARSPALLWAAFSYGTALAIGSSISVLITGPTAADAASADHALALAALVFAARVGLVLIRRRYARQRQGHAWPSLDEVHPKLAPRLRRTSTLVSGMLLLPVLSLGFVPFHPTGGGAGVALTMTVWLLEAAVACVGALVYRRRAAKAARSGSADQPEG